MAKNKKTNEIQAEQVVETEVFETENPKRKIPVKKILFGVGAGVVAIGGAAIAMMTKKRHDQEIADYMDSCGDEGTDLPDDDSGSDNSEASTEE